MLTPWAGQHTSDGVQHTGLVGDLEADQVLGCQLVDRPDAGPAERPERTMGALDEVDRGVDHVAEDRAGRRVSPGAASVEHQRADSVALHEHGVVAVAHAGERVVRRAASPGGHERRPPLATAVTVDIDDGEQLDDVAEPTGDVDVGEREVADPLVVHLPGDDLGA